jgi:hypothetical protein
LSGEPEELSGFNDYQLAGVGAVMVVLRETHRCTDAQLRAMSTDDQRNVAIVEVPAQTGAGSKLQGLINMDIVRAALGVDPVFKAVRPKSHTYFLSIDSFESRTQKSDNKHSEGLADADNYSG